MNIKSTPQFLLLTDKLLEQIYPYCFAPWKHVSNTIKIEMDEAKDFTLYYQHYIKM